MHHQDAVIAYAPAPDSDSPGVDLYHVEDPDTWALDDTLTSLPIGPDGYALPTLDDIETSHDSDTPDLIHKDLTPTWFSDVIDYLTVEEVYLVTPDGVYIFYTIPTAVTFFRLFRDAVTVTGYQHPDDTPNETPGYQVTRQLLDAIEIDDHHFSVLRELHPTLIALGRRDLTRTEQALPEFDTEIDDADISVAYNDLDPFNRLSYKGWLLCLRTPGDDRDGLTEDYRLAHSRAAHYRTGVAFHFHNRLSPTADFDEHLPDIGDHEPYRNGVNPYNAHERSVLELEKHLTDAYDDSISPLSSRKYGRRVAAQHDIPETAILPDTSFTGDPIQPSPR
jgi:hypothetical protein